jgi:hypothetical protein
MLIRKLITKIIVFILPIVIEAVCIGFKRWVRLQSYKQRKHLQNQDKDKDDVNKCYPQYRG